METLDSKMEYESEDIAFNSLEVCNYRHLQGLAKQMGLPSNVKKVELIQMIRAKRYCSKKDLETIVNRVKMQRKANAQLKRKRKKSFRLQGTEVSSTSQSPPIPMTPVRPSEYVFQYGSESPLDIMKNNPRPSVVDAGAPFLQKYKSDRVLRSFRSMRRPNYRILDQTDCVVGVVKSRNTIKEIRHQERVQQIQGIQGRAFQSLNLNVQKQRPIANALRMKGQLVPVIHRTINSGPNPVKRQRKLSGIYPLERQENPEYDMPTVSFRQTDGRICKINAVIQRPLANTLLPKNHTFLQKKSIRSDSTANVNTRSRVTVQDVINYEVDRPTVDLTGPSVMDPNKVLSKIDRPSYERRNVNNQQVESTMKTRPFEQIQDYQSNSSRWYAQDNDNALKLSYQGRTLVHIVPEKFTERDQNRKVYKNLQTSNARKRWNIEIDEEPKAKRPTSKNDINNHLSDTRDVSSQCFSHRAKECRNQLPASTNIKVVPKIISEPMSRESAYQENRDKNMEHARNMEYARNAERARNVDRARYIDFTRNAKKDVNIEVYTSHVYSRNSEGSCTELARADHASKDPNNNLARNMEHARTVEHARNTIPSAIEPPRSEEELRSQYPNMSSITDILPNQDTHDIQSQYSVHYHKEIKAKPVRGNTLPRINEVFSQFNEAYKKLAPPLYVQDVEESERVPLPMTNVNTCLLEKFYNFKSQFLTHSPLGRIVAAQTNCTFSTNTVPTAVEQSTAAEYNNHCNPYERVSAYEVYNENYYSRHHEYTKTDGQRGVVGVEGPDSPTITIGSQASQDKDKAAVPSPEMVDDALELISQDGDYMERIGMDVRVQCILCCDWAGPKFILEYHIKKEHPLEIHHILSPTSRVQLSLSRSPGNRAWTSQLLQYQDTLYALSAQRNETSLLLAFSAIPNDLEIPRRCRITVCNERLKHQPFCYECEILHVPDSMPYEYGQECLALDLASLDLMPNALVNRVECPQDGPELDNVELAVYIQLLE